LKVNAAVATDKGWPILVTVGSYAKTLQDVFSNIFALKVESFATPNDYMAHDDLFFRIFQGHTTTFPRPRTPLLTHESSRTDRCKLGQRGSRYCLSRWKNWRKIFSRRYGLFAHDGKSNFVQIPQAN